MCVYGARHELRGLKFGPKYLHLCQRILKVVFVFLSFNLVLLLSQFYGIDSGVVCLVLKVKDSSMKLFACFFKYQQ